MVTAGELLDGALYARGDADRVFAALRHTSAIAWHATAGGGFWSVVRHAEAAAVLGDPATFSSARGTGHASPHDALATPPARCSLNASDGEVHRRLRALVGAAFGADAAAAQAAWLRARTGALVGALVATGGGDAAALVADVLPLDWIARTLGIDGDDRARLGDAIQQIARHPDPDQRPTLPERDPRATASPLDPLDAGARATSTAGERALFALIAGWIDDRRRHARDDVLGRLVAFGAELDDRDLAYLIRLIALTGHHSTALAIAGAIHALATHPDQAAALAAGAPLAPAIDEMLRWTSPLLRFGRFTTRDTVLAGQPIARGDRVVVWFRSANRDETVFVEPERFDVARSPNPQLAFGGGPHACFGETFVRVQLAAVLAALRGVDLGLAGAPTWLASSVTTGVIALPVTAGRRPGYRAPPLARDR